MFKINNLKKFGSSDYNKTVSLVIYSFALLFCAVVYAFLSAEITKVDVSDSIVVPENYENLLVMDVTMPSAGNLQKDTLLHNGQASSSPGDILSSFSATDWYSDHNGNGAFDGNQISSDNEATISSQDNILDPNDSVKNTGLASLKSFKYSSGVYEQFIDSNHSNSYTSGETVIRTSTNNGEIRQGDVIRSDLADMTSFLPYVRFTDGIQPALNPPKYQDGETIIIDTDPTGILSDADTILKPGNAGLTTFPTDTAYADIDASTKYSSEKAIIIDKDISGKLDSSDEIVKSGKANLKNFGINDLYSDSNGNDKFDPNELVVIDTSGDMKVQPSEIKIPGFANLKTLSGAGFLFSDDNKDTAYSAGELIVKNNGIPEVLESSDVIFKSGKADLKSFANGIEKFIDDNKNGLYDDGECIVYDTGVIGIVESADIEKPGKALLLTFSGHNYLFTDANYNGKYTGGSVLPLLGGTRETIFKDADTNGFIDNGELVTSGNAPVKNFPTPLRFIDDNGNNTYDSGEAMVMSSDNQLSTTDAVVVSGPAFLKPFSQGIIQWAEVNGNDKYDDDELIISSIDDILSPGEIIKSGLCGLKPFPAIYNGYLYSDDNNNDNYSSDELIIASSDKKLDESDSVIRQGKVGLLPFVNTSTLYIDGNNNNAFDQDDAIIDNHNPIANLILLDASDEVLKSGVADINSFADGITYIDQNNDAHYQGDADGDVVWDISRDSMCANDPDIIDDQDEVLLKESVSQNYHALDDGDTVMRPGMAKLTAFPDNIKYIDHYNLGEFTGGIANEAMIQDENGVLESTDTVIITGQAALSDFTDERFIDDNNDRTYTDGEVIWRDSGSVLSVPGKLDPYDEIVKSGRASLLQLIGYKYTNDGVNSDFTGDQAIILDNPPYGILSRNDIQVKPGTADVKDFSANEKFFDCNGDGKYTDGEPTVRTTSTKITVVNPGSLGTFSTKFRYIDSDNSGYYSASGSPLVKTDTEAIILDNGDKELNAGALDGTGPDKVIVSGTAKIKPIGNFASELEPANPQINAYIDSNFSNQLDVSEILITDNTPTDILDPTDVVWGQVTTIVNFPDGDHYLWSGAATLIPIEGSTLDPPNSDINAYIDSYNFGSLDNYEVLINDKVPVGIYDPNDVVIGEIKDKSTGRWSPNLEDGLPWRSVMQSFKSEERYLTNNPDSDYEGQPIINNSTGIALSRWDDGDLLVYDGTPPRSISNNWEQMKYIDDTHDGRYSHSSVTVPEVGDCILDYSLVPPGYDVFYNEIIVTEGKAGFGDFQAGLKFCDQSPNNGIYDINEALVDDVNNNNMIDQGEVVSAGTVVDNKLTLPLKYVDANHDSKFNGNEAIISDNGNGLLDAGKLDSTGTDKVISSGEADLSSFNRAEKFVDGNSNSSFDVGEAIIYDWYDTATFAGEFILAGNHVDKDGSLTYLSPGTRNRDCVIMPSEIGKAGIVGMNYLQKYIDYNHSGNYNGFYDSWNGIDYEPIINSANDQLDKGKLNGSGTDTLIASGYCLRDWDSNLMWADSNHDNTYQDNEAIVFDALGDAMIKSIGTGANDDRIIVSGDADLNDFTDMKYIDANSNNEVDFGTELTAIDTSNDNKLTNEKIVEAGKVPFLKPFTSSDYRYCDWDHDDNYDPQQEAIVYTPLSPEILDTEDEIVASGSDPALTAFNPQLYFLDNNQNNIYDVNEAIISGDGDQVFNESDQIIIHGIASSFDGTNVKYASTNPSDPYKNGDLIADTSDDILEEAEILTPGTVNLANFDINDRYADSNHNGRYDYKVFNTGFGEAILADGTVSGMVETGNIKTDGYADLRSYDGTKIKFSDSGARDQQYNDGELLINDVNNDEKVQPSEIIYDGPADLKGFPANVMYCDSDRDDKYSGIEAIVSSEDDILHTSDTVLAEGEANLHGFEQNIYRFADSDHDGKYSTGEAIIVEKDWGIVDDILDDSDLVIFEGSADINQFPSDFKFLDDLNDSGEYENGEAIVYDSNSNNLLDQTDEIVTSGRASVKKFVTTEKYSDGGDNANNSIYDSDEAIIRDGNADGKLSSGPLDGTGTDAVLASGKAGLRHFNDNEKYVDANGNSQYDSNEDIYRDEDNNGIVTGEGSDQLVYFVVENIGTATNSDLANVKLWADRDRDGVFEPKTDDAPYVKILISDTSNPKIWYEGPAIASPLSAISSRTSIGYLIPSVGQRFFVSIDTGNNSKDGNDIQMSIPKNGVKTLYGSSSPTDNPVTNAYKQTIDHSTPNIATIISPLANDTIYGNIILRAEAGDSVQAGKVEFYDGLPDGIRQPIAVDEDGSPWEAEWDCSNAGFGEHTLYARVYDKTYQNLPKTNTINHYLDSQGVHVTVGIAQIISLVAGWNYVSLPMEPFNTDVTLLLSSIGTNARSIWAYDAVSSKWLRYDLDGPDFLNDLNTVKAGIGYQIFMTDSGILKVAGTLPDTAISLLDGWNFVGCNAQSSIIVENAISSIIANHPSIWTINPENSEWLGYDPENPPNDLTTIDPKKAYWVHVTGSCVWNVNTQ